MLQTKKGRGGAAPQREQCSKGTEGVRAAGPGAKGETGGKGDLVAGLGPGWCSANRPLGTRRYRTIWGVVKERGAAGAPG